MLPPIQRPSSSQAQAVCGCAGFSVGVHLLCLLLLQKDRLWDRDPCRCPRRIYSVRAECTRVHPPPRYLAWLSLRHSNRIVRAASAVCFRPRFLTTDFISFFARCHIDSASTMITTFAIHTFCFFSVKNELSQLPALQTNALLL